MRQGSRLLFEIKRRSISFAIMARAVMLFSLLLVLPCSSTFAEKKLTKNRALNVLVAQIKKDNLYASWPNLSCLVFLTEDQAKNYFDFAIHEKHGGKCPGDPAISPVVDRFRVDRVTKKISWYDPIKDEFSLYKDALNMKLLQQHR